MRRRLEQNLRKVVFAARRLSSGFPVGQRLPSGVSARAACAVDVAGDVLIASRADAKWPPASLVKLATALVLLRFRRDRLDERVCIERRDCVGGSSASLRAGDEVALLDLIHGLLLPSGNDAAQAIARHVGEALPAQRRSGRDPVSRFVDEMNRLAADLGLSRTRFVNPSGFDRAGQYSTARDLARLASVAFSDPMLREITASTRRSVCVAGDRPRRVDLLSTVPESGERYFECAKTGSTRGAKACLAVRSDVGGTPAFLVVLGSDVRFTADGMPIPGSDRRFADARAILRCIRAQAVGLAVSA